MVQQPRKILLTTRRHLEEHRNPIAILDLAQYLRVRGDIVDCYYLDQIAHVKNTPRYDLVGLSVLQATNEETPVNDALLLKDFFKTQTVIGGKWADTATAKQKSILLDHQIDLHVGPGELYFCDDNAQEIDFDSYPAWNKQDFKTLDTVCSEIMTSRGCPFHCNFCHNTEKKISFFNVNRTIANISTLLELGAQEIFIVDDIFTIEKTHMESIHKGLSYKNISLENRCKFFTHVNFVNDSTIPWMIKFCPTEVQIGIESGDDEMLKNMGKGFVKEKAFGSIARLHAAGIKVGALFLIGFPGETVQSLKNTLQFIKRIKNHVRYIWVSYYQPVRGTVGWQLTQNTAHFDNHGKRNTDIVYVDPNLSEAILREYKQRMINEFRWRSRRQFLMRLFKQSFRYITAFVKG